MIPKELIFEIFLCLSVEDLLRFRCFSKAFCQEIDSDAFMTAHLNRSKKTKTHGKLVVYHNNGYSKDNGLYDFDDENEISLFGNRDGCFFMDGFDVYGSCNGLFLFYNNATWLLLNPFTRTFDEVIRCPAKTRCYGQSLFGFGYDSINNDYKLVRIIEEENHHYVKIWVFSFSSNTWRKQKVPFCHNKTFPSHNIFDNRSIYENRGLFADGALHWLCEEIDKGTGTVTVTHEIVTLDVSKEVFVNLVHSDSLSPSPCIGKAYLLVIGGSLALLRHLDSNELLELYLAVKCEEHYYTWTKLYDISSLELCHSSILTDPILRSMERSTNEILVPFKDIVAQRDFGGGLSWISFISFCWETLVWPATHSSVLTELLKLFQTWTHDQSC
ncbi:hypothetical protein COLO4_14607 [Corchorus olitorius]|uniref:F-box domain-containing protein n=1 Tax=Corchorus olitorius TaxID=93759 RepID=A0A1R3JRJ2_9ROSI|nr:hypothetical protein COLO4_14607 [Corchorus olitorius]